MKTHTRARVPAATLAGPSLHSPGTPEPPPSQESHPKMTPAENTPPTPGLSVHRDTGGHGTGAPSLLVPTAPTKHLDWTAKGQPELCFSQVWSWEVHGVRPHSDSGSGSDATFSRHPVTAGRRTGQLSGPDCQGPAPVTSPPPTASPPNAIPEVRISTQESRGTQTLGGPTFLSHCLRKGCTISQVISGQHSPSVYQEDSITPS